jgi:Di-N-acetylchitobiase
MMRESSGQVYGFTDMLSTGEMYNWTHIGTVAWAASEEIICRAHEHGARAVVAAPSFSLTLDDFNITSWVHTSLYMVQARHADGIVFDYESPLTTRDDEARRTYVSLISTTRAVFSQYNLQVTTCVAWSPDGIDGRNYPYADLADASDFLYVMDYDTQSQIFGPCIASANAPYFGMIRGIERYLELGIDAQKLILGVPWYGYRYPCLEGTTVDARFCPIAQVPFRGVNCSDAAGTEVTYGTILRTYKTTKDNSGMKRDDYMDAVYFNTVDNDGTVYQYFFDDAKSMRNKFSWAKSMGLGGVGPYTFGDLDPVGSPEESEAMWSAFDVFRSTDQHTNKVILESGEMEDIV